MRLARAQHGVLTWAQLSCAGLTAAQIKTLAGRGMLWRMHRGVYSIADPALLPLAAESAAVLAFGAGSLLSHRSAAALWNFTTQHPGDVELTLVAKNPRGRPGVRVHRVRALDRTDMRRQRNLAVTAPARTIIDLAAVAKLADLHEALANARIAGHVNDDRLRAALTRCPPKHPGATTARDLLEAPVGTLVTRSKMERTLLGLIDQAGLPRPLVNHPLGPYQLDFYWPDARLAVEVDGYGAHSGRKAFEHDRLRDQRLAALGIITIRITWWQLELEPMAVMVRVGQALTARAA